MGCPIHWMSQGMSSNQLPSHLNAGKNAISFDRVDTFEVTDRFAKPGFIGITSGHHQGGPG